MILENFSPQGLILLLLAVPFAAVALQCAVWRPLRNYSRARRTVVGLFTVLASFVSLVLSVWAISPVLRKEIQFTFGTAFYIDALSVYFIIVVNIVTFVSSWSTLAYTEYSEKITGETKSLWFHVLFNLFHATMILVLVVDNLVALWMAVELTTVVSAILMSHEGSRGALEASWKYIIITSTGVIFALLGTMVLANGLAPETPLDWSWMVGHAKGIVVNENLVRLSFLFILVGYGTKAGLAPMFTWLPDGHGEAPWPVSALLSGVLLKCAFFAILRFSTITRLFLPKQADQEFLTGLILCSGLFSLVVAVPFILKPNRFKRILAYHSLEHMGIIAFGTGIGNPVALMGGLLHSFNHALTKALMFLAYGHVQSAMPPEPRREEVRGLLRSMPWTSAILVLGGLALVGSPPFNIFLSESLILMGAMSKANDPGSPLRWTAIAVFVAAILLIYVGLVRHLGKMLLGKPAGTVVNVREQPVQLVLLTLLLIVVLASGVKIAHPLEELLLRSVQIVTTGVMVQ
jgi:hydrogenase-4 component F